MIYFLFYINVHSNVFYLLSFLELKFESKNYSNSNMSSERVDTNTIEEKLLTLLKEQKT
jgi:hypothetical protein